MQRNAIAAASAARRYLKRGLLGLLAILLALGGVLYAKSEHIVLGAEAYVFGYPLVIMDVTRARAHQNLGPENELHRVRQFPDAQFKSVVRPNVDTLYTSAFIDMAQGPWVFEMAPNSVRYELMPFMDAWTNVFASPGTRTTGTGGGVFLLAGPGWNGPTPEGMQLLRSPTRMVWLIGRTQTNGTSDFPVVHRLQDGLKLHRLGAAPVPLATPADQGRSPLAPDLAPLATMKAMGTLAFFERLSALMVDNPPAAADGPMVMKLARIGLVAGQPPQWGWLDRLGVGVGRWIADFKLAQELDKLSDPKRGWSTPPAVLGQYGTYYNIRAGVAIIGLGANLPADATYPITRGDANGQSLNGKHRYKLHFKPGSLPPVNAFWSLTAYGADDYLIDNPLQRFALGDRDPLVYNPDGSLDLWIQSKQPTGQPLSNWLPVKPDQAFSLNARLYWPKPSAVNAAWRMPAVERLD